MRSSGSRLMLVVRRRGSEDPFVDLLADEVDAEGNEGDAEARSGVPELIRQHRVLPPLVPPLEELSRGSQWLLRHSSLSLSLVSTVFVLLLLLLSLRMVDDDDINILASIWFCWFGLVLGCAYLIGLNQPNEFFIFIYLYNSELYHLIVICFSYSSKKIYLFFSLYNLNLNFFQLILSLIQPQPFLAIERQ